MHGGPNNLAGEASPQYVALLHCLRFDTPRHSWRDCCGDVSLRHQSQSLVDRNPVGNTNQPCSLRVGSALELIDHVETSQES